MSEKKKARDAVVMTVYNRAELVLANTLLQLGKNQLDDTVIIIVDDGSDKVQYPGGLNKLMAQLPIELVRCDTVKDRPGTYHIDGYNNPAYAFNVGLHVALEKYSAEYLYLVSSDVMLPPHALSTARTCNLKNSVLVGKIVDLDSAGEFCSGVRVWPMPWFAATHMQNVTAIGGWDEAYLNGIAFEDNDFMARLFCQTGHMLLVDAITSWHQSHQQQAYSDQFQGWDINEKYIYDRFGCVPFRRNDRPFEYQLRCVKRGLTHLIEPKTWKYNPEEPQQKPVEQEPEKQEVAHE